MARIKTGGSAQKILAFLMGRHKDGPFTERQILDQVRPKGCSPRWGNSYFLVGRGNAHEISLIKRGLIDVVASSTRGARMYAISDAGRYALWESQNIRLSLQCNRSDP